MKAKTKTKMLAILILLMTGFFLNSKKVSAQPDYVSFQVFYTQLSPYGQWIENPDFGYVWLPDAGPDFVPYSTGGNWVMTDYGWTWYSSYNWGWAPFHYGRWGYDNYYGWYWVPDNEWGPAWVSWRSADGYYGWTPLEPGISISVSFGRDYHNHGDHWIFVRDRNLWNSNISQYYVNQNDRDRIIVNSVTINNTYVDNSRHTTYITGPAIDDVQRATGRKVSHVAIQESTTPEQRLKNGRLEIYRPQIAKVNDGDRRAAPTATINQNAQKQPSQRVDANHQWNGNNAGSANREQSPNSVNPKENNAKPEQQHNINQSQKNENVKQPDPVVPSDKNSNFNNTYKNSDAVRSINSMKDSKNRNIDNSSKSNPETIKTDAKAKPQQDAAQSSRSKSNKKSGTPVHPDKSKNDQKNKSRSAEEKK